MHFMHLQGFWSSHFYDTPEVHVLAGLFRKYLLPVQTYYWHHHQVG